MRILIVDDSATIRAGLRSLLEKMGHAVAEADEARPHPRAGDVLHERDPLEAPLGVGEAEDRAGLRGVGHGARG